MCFVLISAIDMSNHVVLQDLFEARANIEGKYKELAKTKRKVRRRNAAEKKTKSQVAVSKNVS